MLNEFQQNQGDKFFQVEIENTHIDLAISINAHSVKVCILNTTMVIVRNEEYTILSEGKMYISFQRRLLHPRTVGLSLQPDQRHDHCQGVSY